MNSGFKWIGVLMTALILLVIACKEPTEGCLDIEATNYDVSADDPCSDCCVYPQLSFEISHRYQDSIIFSYDSIYQIEGTSFDTRFDKIIFYLSDFKLVGTDDSLEISETIELELLNGDIETFKDDFVIVSRSISSFQYEIGEIRGSGNFNTLKFTLGIEGNAANGDASTVVNEEHPLAIGTDSLWTETEGYIFHQIVVVPDTLNPPVDSVRIININGQDNLGFVELAYDVEVDLGFDISIPIKIDYKKLLEGINFVVDSDDDIAGKIVTNTANAFSITE